MSLKSIKHKTQAERGFTIVELLIVVVVIAILAAITIVSYNGITNRANASSAQSTAAALQKKAELFISDGPTGSYPARIADLTGVNPTTGVATAIQNSSPSTTTSSSNTWYVAPGTINITATPSTAPTPANGKNTVQLQPCGTFSSGTTSAALLTTVAGVKIVWYDFSKTSSQLTTIDVGNTGTGCATAA